MRTLLAIALGLACLPAAHAQVKSLEGASLGTHVMGPKYTNADLKGRVVFIEVWGVN